MRHGIRCNLVDIANQLFFAYRSLAWELRVFVMSLTEVTKAFDVIRALKEKEEVWHKIMTTPTTSPRYYNLAQRLSPSFYNPLLPS